MNVDKSLSKRWPFIKGIQNTKQEIKVGRLCIYLQLIIMIEAIPIKIA